MKRIIRTTMTGSLLRTSRTQDELLTSLTPEESAANSRRTAEMMALDLGSIWDGVQQSPAPAESFGKLPAGIQDELVAKFGAPAQQLATAAKASGVAGTLSAVTVVTDGRSRARDGAQAAGAMRTLIRGMNQRGTEFWKGRERDTGIKPHDAVQAQLQGINATNRAFWASLNGVGVRR